MRKKLLVTGALMLAIFLLATPLMTPSVYAAAKPCLTTSKCGITILSPGSGGLLNSTRNVGPSFVVSFAVHNFSLQNPGTYQDVNTTTSAPIHNEGHIHVYVDGFYLMLWTSTNGIPLTLTQGTHTIQLRLVNDYHQEFSPGINASTTVNVVDPLQTTNNAASNAMYFSLGALIVAIIAVAILAYGTFKPKSKGS